MRHGIVALAIGLVVLVASPVLGAGKDKYEVWAIDQSNSPGLAYGGTVHIWDGHDLENLRRGPAIAERIDLAGAAATLCAAKTGALPVRPHMIAMNPAQTHAVISFVASGHVLFVHAATRTPVACFRTTPGAAGARQAHMSTPSPDGTYVTVANQNGKLFERIRTDYANNAFVHETAATLNLAGGCLTPNGFACEDPVLRPDNAPICPITESTSRYTFVTLRGGGLFVVDSRATPMEIVGEYDRDTVHGNGCLGAEVGGKMYIDSGGGTSGNVHQADVYAFPVDGYSADNPPNTPPRTVVLSEDVPGADAHGAALTKHGKYLWIADRGRNFLWVIDTATDEVVNRIPLEGDVSGDPTPDLVALSPNGSHAFLSLRGPNPLTADPHVSTGSTPGVAVLKVTGGGRNAVFEAVARVSNIDAALVERADVHAMTVRVVPHR
jgi:DNA-binding beta-propeller fold protein YncE